MHHVLGVDGGNSKTIALVVREDGTVLSHGRAGCADIYAMGSPQHGIEQILRAADAALQRAHVGRDGLDAAAFSLAGADWPEDFELLRAALHSEGFGPRLSVVNDAMGALRAGSREYVGVAVACGTGAALGARSADGRIWHHSWWQEPQCGLELAQRALRAVYRAELGIDGPTDLTPRLLQTLGFPDVEQVLHLFTSRDARGPRDYRAATRVLLDAAEAGDPTAVHIVVSQGQALGDYALAAARRVGLEACAYDLVLVGGVLRHPCALLPQAIVQRVMGSSTGARPVFSRFEPAVGACLLALDTLGVPQGAALGDRLAASIPPPDVFST